MRVYRIVKRNENTFKFIFHLTYLARDNIDQTIFKQIIDLFSLSCKHTQTEHNIV